jgi:hypothetical protein
MTVSKEQVDQVRQSWWAGMVELAQKLPNHQVLSVEMLRTPNDETVAVLTVVKDQRPVQYIVRGDARGRVKSQTGEVAHGKHHCAAVGHQAMALMAPAGSAPTNAADPNLMAISEPPPKQPPTPGVIDLGGALMSVGFGVGDPVKTDAKT